MNTRPGKEYAGFVGEASAFVAPAIPPTYIPVTPAVMGGNVKLISSESFVEIVDGNAQLMEVWT